MTFDGAVSGFMIIGFIVIIVAEFVLGHVPDEDD